MGVAGRKPQHRARARSEPTDEQFDRSVVRRRCQRGPASFAFRHPHRAHHTFPLAVVPPLPGSRGPTTSDRSVLPCPDQQAAQWKEVRARRRRMTRDVTRMMWSIVVFGAWLAYLLIDVTPQRIGVFLIGYVAFAVAWSGARRGENARAGAPPRRPRTTDPREAPHVH